MTIAQIGQCVNVSAQGQFISSNEQMVMHEAVQVELVQTSDLRGLVHEKEQQTATHHQCAVLQERHNLWAEGHRKPKMIYGQENRMNEEKKYVNERDLFAESLKTKAKSDDGGFDPLLILAQSAELLLESEDNFHHYEINKQSHEDQSYMKNTLDATQENAKVVADNNASLLQVRIRLTQIRHQARMKNCLVVQEIKGKKTHEHVDIKGLGGTGIRQRLAADQIQVAMDHRAIEAQPWFEQTRYQREKSCLGKPLNGLHQPSAQNQSVIANEPSELADQYAASQLKLLKTDKQIDLSDNQHLNTPQGELQHPLMRDQVETMEPLLVQIPKMQKNHRSVVCQQRLLRTLKRRRCISEKHCGAQKIQRSKMSKTHSSMAWEQQMLKTVEQKINHSDKCHVAAQNECHLMDSGKMNQVYGAGQQWVVHVENIQNGQLHGASQRLQLNVSDAESQRLCVVAHHNILEQEQRLSLKMHPEQELHLEMNQSCQAPCFTKFCEDQCVKPLLCKQVNATAEIEEKSSCPRRQIRLSQLKKEARL